MVFMFIEQTPQLVAEMTAKHQRGDYRAMSSIAHKIRPSIDNMGIVSLSEPFREIERIGKAGEGLEALPALVQKISKDLAAVVDELQSEFEVNVS